MTSKDALLRTLSRKENDGAMESRITLLRTFKIEISHMGFNPALNHDIIEALRGDYGGPEEIDRIGSGCSRCSTEYPDRVLVMPITRCAQSRAPYRLAAEYAPQQRAEVIRLNAGWVESLVLGPGGLRILVDKKTAPAATPFDGCRYRLAPGCETAAIALSDIPRWLPKLLKAHKKALEVAAARLPSRQILSGHSTGVTKWLSRVLDRPVADPILPPQPLHIVQGGVDNGDKVLLERLAQQGLRTRSWVVPKSVRIGDETVIYIGGFGFFATAQIGSEARPHRNWENRYSAGLTSIQLIEPAISLAAIRHHIPELEWTKYPRSIVTPTAAIAERVRILIAKRRKGEIEITDDFLSTANKYELRKVALLRSKGSLPQQERKAIYRARSIAIRKYVLLRADGLCEGCGSNAPFRGRDGAEFLETHHTTRVADDGPDHPAKVIGLCPNCHRRAHHAEDQKAFNDTLIRKLGRLEAAIKKG